MTFKKANNTTKSKSNKIYDVAQVKVSKSGTTYIEVKKDVTLPAGTKLFLTSMVDSIKSQMERGSVDQAKGNALLERYSEGGDLDFILQKIDAVLE